MARPIWKGNISFGLVTIPITLYSAEKKSDLHFKLLDSRDHAHIRYERINEVTGEEVPWDEVVKAYEYNKGNYVVLESEDFIKAAPERTQLIEIQDFVDRKSVDCLYFEKPYYLVPSKVGQKGYVLLRETLKRTNEIGIAKVVIHAREYLSVLMPQDEALLLNLLRFPQEIRNEKDFEFPKGDLKKFKIHQKEIEMAERLVKSMTTKWNPKKYHDEYREILMRAIERKLSGGKAFEAPTVEKPLKPEKGAKVIDFSTLLKRSISEKGKKSVRQPVSRKAKASSLRRKKSSRR